MKFNLFLATVLLLAVFDFSSGAPTFGIAKIFKKSYYPSYYPSYGYGGYGYGYPRYGGYDDYYGGGYGAIGGFGFLG
jgi:hypothetical protein